MSGQRSQNLNLISANFKLGDLGQVLTFVGKGLHQQPRREVIRVRNNACVSVR